MSSLVGGDVSPGSLQWVPRQRVCGHRRGPSRTAERATTFTHPDDVFAITTPVRPSVRPFRTVFIIARILIHHRYSRRRRDKRETNLIVRLFFYVFSVFSLFCSPAPVSETAIARARFSVGKKQRVSGAPISRFLCFKYITIIIIGFWQNVFRFIDDWRDAVWDSIASATLLRRCTTIRRRMLMRGGASGINRRARVHGDFA